MGGRNVLKGVGGTRIRALEFSERSSAFNGSLIAIHANLDRKPLGPSARTIDSEECAVTSSQQACPLVQTMP